MFVIIQILALYNHYLPCFIVFIIIMLSLSCNYLVIYCCNLFCHYLVIIWFGSSIDHYFVMLCHCLVIIIFLFPLICHYLVFIWFSSLSGSMLSFSNISYYLSLFNYLNYTKFVFTSFIIKLFWFNFHYLVIILSLYCQDLIRFIIICSNVWHFYVGTYVT